MIGDSLLDTIFRNYPSPAIFLHKNIAEDGSVKYHVVDGKQRLETIFSFVKKTLRLAADYGDIRLDGKRWRDIDDIELKHQFWNYQITVEMIDAREGELVRNVFDRLNRNSRRLTAQELRHARFEGWLITKAESEAELDEWAQLGVATRARSSRMIDVQFISELMAVLLRGRPLGFSQEDLDLLYSEYEDLQEIENFDEEQFEISLERTKERLLGMEAHDKAVTTWAKGVGHLYSLWSVLALTGELPENAELARRYAAFMRKVEELNDAPPEQPVPEGAGYAEAARYRENSRGASTEEAQRIARYDVLREILVQQ